MKRLLPMLLVACSPQEDELIVTLESLETGLADTGAPADTGAEPAAEALEASPPTLDLGDVTIDCEARGEVLLRHGEQGEMAVAIALGSGSFNPRFAIEEPRPTALPAGTDTPVGIRFRTPDPGPHQAILSVTPTDGGDPLQVRMRAQSRPGDACGADTDSDAG